MKPKGEVQCKLLQEQKNKQIGLYERSRNAYLPNVAILAGSGNKLLGGVNDHVIHGGLADQVLAQAKLKSRVLQHIHTQI